MSWNQKKAMMISDVRVIADLFKIGCNWNNRKEKLKTIMHPKAQKLAAQLQLRLEAIHSYMEETGCIMNVNSQPDWFRDIRFRPFQEALREELKSREECKEQK